MSKSKTFPLKENFAGANYGINAATCVICHEQSVGQTMNKFSMRWSSHLSDWKRSNCKNDKMTRMKWRCRGTIQCSTVS